LHSENLQLQTNSAAAIQVYKALKKLLHAIFAAGRIAAQQYSYAKRL